MKSILKKIVIKIITWQAIFLIKRKKPTIIAITGNLGKTTTKDMVYAALKRNLLTDKKNSTVLASKKSMNSDFGVPLTILRFDSGWNDPIKWFFIILSGFVRMFGRYDYKYFILEIGADAPGDIKKITEYIKPDIAILTGFAEVPVHIEFFDNDREKLVREKKYLIENIKDGGTFIYNLDDEDCVKIAKDIELENEKIGKTITLKSFSIRNTDADVCAFNIRPIYDEKNIFISKILGTSANVILLKGSENIEIEMLGVVGDAIFYSLLPAILIADLLKVDIKKSVSDIENTKRTPGRMRVLNGVYNSTIIDDSYNSSPKALKHGIQIMKNLKTKGRKIFVLGDMLELGNYTKEEHENVGKTLVGVADILFVSGIRAKIIGDSALQNNMDGEKVYFVGNSVDAGRELLLVIEDKVDDDRKKGRDEEGVGGDLIFIKGSQGARMEKVVEMVLDRQAHDQKKDIVRQDSIWRNK